MTAQAIAPEDVEEDIEVLAAILEQEKVNHCRTRSLCFGLFVFSFVFLVVVLACVAFMLLTGAEQLTGSIWLPVLQILAPLSAAMIGFFASWCAVHNCINSIDRSLYAAHAKKYRLFAGFLNEMQCASKKKRSMWVDMLGAVIA